MSERQLEGADGSKDQWLEMEAMADDRPLPPLPDGGLGATMPDWLRATPVASESPLQTHGDVASRTRVETADTPTPASPPWIDPTRFLDEDDVPVWLRRLAATEPGSTERSGSHHERVAAVVAAQAPSVSGVSETIRAQPAPPDEEPATPLRVPPHPIEPSPTRRREGGWVPIVLALLLVAIAALAVALATGLLS
jgi:hypothetical protein